MRAVTGYGLLLLWLHGTHHRHHHVALLLLPLFGCHVALLSLRLAQLCHDGAIGLCVVRIEFQLVGQSVNMLACRCHTTVLQIERRRLVHHLIGDGPSR
jgi:hypothetical protein